MQPKAKPKTIYADDRYTVDRKEIDGVPVFLLYDRRHPNTPIAAEKHAPIELFAQIGVDWSAVDL